jgi:hypothetical protein
MVPGIFSSSLAVASAPVRLWQLATSPAPTNTSAGRLAGTKKFNIHIHSQKNLRRAARIARGYRGSLTFG